MSIYSAMAHHYDAFTDDVPYAEWAAYVQTLFAKFQADPKLVLDLACGTGSLTVELAKAGYEMIGVDMSADMLSEAMQKSAELDIYPLFLKQRMETLDLYGTVDAIVCGLDSVNYLVKPGALDAAFSRVSLFLEDNGLFIFDVNTEKKFQTIDMQAFVRESDTCFCVWQADYDAKTRLMEYYLDFFVHQENGRYDRYSEHHTERMYPLEELQQTLERHEMRLEGVFGELSTEAPTADADRIFIVARRLARQA
ncbi:MAG: class I SAM-dependent methyltransferase [Clostridia bacterium]|nr:class I SAM-dependent methyltransferase [Clostridia bacterium]